MERLAGLFEGVGLCAFILIYDDASDLTLDLTFSRNLYLDCTRWAYAYAYANTAYLLTLRHKNGDANVVTMRLCRKHTSVSTLYISVAWSNALTT